MTDPNNSQLNIAMVVFDWAGTMIDHGSRAPASVFVQAFAKHDIEITTDQARGPMGMAKRAHIQTIASYPEVAAAWQAQHGRAFAESDIDAIYAAFLPLQLACLHDYCQVIPGVVEMIDQLRGRGIKIGSSTGYTKELMDVVLREAEHQGLTVDAMLCASDFDEGRPAPWMIYENARRLGVYPMNRVIKIDDTVAGVQAGRNAGCWTIGVSRTGNLIGLSEAELAELEPAEQERQIAEAQNTLIEAGAHGVIESAADIVEVIEAIERQAVPLSEPTSMPAGQLPLYQQS